MQTLLYADALRHGWQLAEVELLAQQFDGRTQACSGGGVLLSFDHPLVALRAALLLQKIGADTGVSAGLTTGQCTVAHFKVDGKACSLVLPPEATRAEERARRAPPATVVIGPETHDLLAHCPADEVEGGLVTTECEGDRVTQVSITLAPHVTADLSTFAGPGMH
ncbi:hypothetical protein HK414_09095 [Ramlibacter terrae]|uniref:Uncharacterized protein n=1 Tax=Ramlibacter terrae TaxID=2732511 RepID=A0ABX6P1Q5_9BURK|nr:hypothetical protein HK414_09095 [Ramlibacter terrae]